MALKLIEKDKKIYEKLEVCCNYQEIEETTKKEIEKLEIQYEEDSETLITDTKYGFISGALKTTYKLGPVGRRKNTEIIDTIFTHKLWGFPVFVFFMWLMFQSTFTLGSYPMDWIDSMVGVIGSFISSSMPDGMLKDLLVDGIIAGVELHTFGDYTITGSTLPEGWEYYNNNDIILIVDMAGTGVSEDMTLYYDGTMQIENSLLSDWSGNGISASLNIIPDTFILESAYPNPFNPTTTLRFAIPVDSEVSISVYNLQGREVVSLVNGKMEAGYHTAVWNADVYSSGIYFVKLIAGEYLSTQKLMLVK